MKISSSAFSHGSEIPREYTCEGRDISPPLAWESLPPDTVTLALIVDDPDAPDPENPRTTWVHWVVYDLPAGANGLPANATDLPGEAREGTNDWGRLGWGGPCPPIGRHRYFFKLYALESELGDIGQPTKAELERAIDTHVLARSELIGTYRKSG